MNVKLRGRFLSAGRKQNFMNKKPKRGRPKNEHAAEIKEILKMKPRGERAAPNQKKSSNVINPLPGKYDYLNEIAYSITDQAFGTLNVRKTANAWWEEKTKVEELILSFKLGCTLEESFVMAGITKRQYDHFMDMHPDFCEVRPTLMKTPTLAARRTLVSHLHDPQYALAYLERKEKKEFSKSSIEINGDPAEDLGVIILPVRQSPEGVRVQTEILGK